MIILVMMAADEKTEKATPKKRRDARERGEVLKSQEVSTAVMLLSLFGVLKVFTGYLGEKTASVFVDLMKGMATSSDQFTTGLVSTYFGKVIISLLMILAPMLIAALIVGLAVNYVQVGFLFSKKALQPKMSRLNPMQGMKRIFSGRSMAELVKSIAKTVIIGLAVYDVIKSKAGDVPGLMNYDLKTSLTYIIDTSMELAFRVGIFLAILAAGDYFYQWLQYEKNLRMTKQEIKEEFRQLEGDPKIKGQIRQKQRQMGMMRMMQAVPKADVIITNPTHYAIALKYDDKVSRAPVVIAKGKDLVAQKIKEKAREHNIHMVENKPLAQALYVSTDIGEQIPEDLYKAVAEILAQVYKLKKR